jgi:hypothetical protein
MQAEFKCSYMGTVEYRVWSRDFCAIVDCRLSLGDYERSIANGADCLRDMEAKVGLGSIGLDAPPPEAIGAINAHRRQKWQEACDRFGALEIGPPPEDVRAGRWAPETSWTPA